MKASSPIRSRLPSRRLHGAGAGAGLAFEYVKPASRWVGGRREVLVALAGGARRVVVKVASCG